MFKTLTGRFTFFFWLLFLIVTIPIFIFTNYHYIDILKKSEKEKITLTLDTVEPIIALNLSFDQQKQLHNVLDSLFKHSDIEAVRLNSIEGSELFFKSTNTNDRMELFLHKSTITDPFDNKEIAMISITYSNMNLSHFQREIHLIIFLIFAFSLFIFSITYFYIRDDLNSLRIISNSLQEYSLDKNIHPIVQTSKTKEIRTIADIANQMLSSIADYIAQLKSFNIELEDRVKDGIIKQQKQERMMIHQSRQAAMGEMLESIAHQWRQPLNIIGLATTNLETEYALGIMGEKEFNDKINIISTNINYMSDTIDDFRNFLNPKRKQSSFSPEKSIQEVLTIVHAQLHNNSIVYSLHTDCNPVFYGVENEFKQVMLVLLNNSKDALKTLIGKKLIHEGLVTISLECRENQAIVELCDNGGGIDSEIIDDIFNPYFTTKESSNGTGIGLYIAKNIIENRMKGKMMVRNTKAGCCFTIVLPLKKKEEI